MLEAEGEVDGEGLVGDALAELELLLELIGQQEVDRGGGGPGVVMPPIARGGHTELGGEGLEVGEGRHVLDVGLEAAVDAAGALDHAHRVPVHVVVDDLGGVLEVDALGEHVGGEQHVDRVLQRAGPVLAP